MSLAHIPVLVDEVVTNLVQESNGSYLDATFGSGGHTRALLSDLGSDARVLVVDRDPTAVEAAQSLAKEDSRVCVCKGNFSELGQLAEENGFANFDGILMDIGISSTQVDSPERGFSFQHEGPLDMRMDPTSGFTAGEWLNKAALGEMATVFKRYGDERNARSIARGIVARRPLETTSDLVDVIDKASKTVDRRKHSATRVFQAIRILVNDEINELRQGLRRTFDLLAPKGRLAVISFHSIEHQIVRRQFKAWTTSGMPDRMPIRGKNEGPLKFIVRGKRPSHSQIEENSRARSAMLQVVQRVR